MGKAYASLTNGILNTCLVLISVLAILVLLESGLRLFYPKYQYAAESVFQEDAYRIYARKPNVETTRVHPDTRRDHPVLYNNLALRQHRDFRESELASAINVGFFGDSFTENLRLPTQYSFTEVLDYLLNLGSATFNVLNLGVDGYGTGQAFLAYKDFEYAKHLQHVFHVFCINDLRNIYENQLFHLEDSGVLQQATHVGTPWWKRTASRFHVTYLFYDLWKTSGLAERDATMTLFSDEAASRQELRRTIRNGRKARHHSKQADAIEASFLQGEANQDLETSIAILQGIINSWSEAVEQAGGQFHVVLLPRVQEHKARGIFPGNIDVIDLYEEFENHVPGYRYRDYRFENNAHWNEVGNLLAAIALSRAMANTAMFVNSEPETLKEELYRYYSAFEGWMPDPRWMKKVELDERALDQIDAKYRELERR